MPDQVYKLFVRPNFDCGDIICHKFDPDRRLDLSKILEQTQCSAALAGTRIWRGTSRQCLYEELGWEGLYSRQRYRRICHFYQLRLTRSPGYLFSEIPCERQLTHNLCNIRPYDQ